MHSSLKLVFSKLLSPRTLFILTCLLFLSYQSSLILWQYSQQNYVTNIQFIKNHMGSLPALTICYDRFLSFESLFRRFPDADFVLELKENYTKLMTKVDGIRLYQVDNEMRTQFEMFDNHHKRLQELMMNEMKPPYIYSGLSGYQDLFANITMRGTYIENNQTICYYKPGIANESMTDL